jgi:hypothetical protein
MTTVVLMFEMISLIADRLRSQRQASPAKSGAVRVEPA